MTAGRMLNDSDAKSMPQRMMYSSPMGSVYMVPLAPGQSEVATAAPLEDVDEAIICVDEGVDVAIISDEDSTIELPVMEDAGIDVPDIIMLVELASSHSPNIGSQFSAAQ